MKSIILLILLLFAEQVTAQLFEQFNPEAPFYGDGGAFADVDGDDDQDLIISGRLYINEGMRGYIERQSTPFELSARTTHFSDIDGDGDADVLLTGSRSNSYSKLYTNDGTGSFTEVNNTPFVIVKNGSKAFFDIDGDGDEDLLITGDKSNDYSIKDPVSRLYINDGLGTFTEVSGTPFEGAYNSAIAFSDVDGDGDNDVLITGRNSNGNKSSKLYLNNGLGSFTRVVVPFDGIESGSIAFSDIDGDGDQDLLMIAYLLEKLYLNDGNGVFSLISNTPFIGMSYSYINFFDADNDGDNDVIITGLNGNVGWVTILYINDGGGNFSELTGTPFSDRFNDSNVISDFDNDGDQDILITGGTAKLYINQGSNTFSNTRWFYGVDHSAMDFSDIDGDGDQDVLIIGNIPNNNRSAILYTNDGNGVFAKVQDNPFLNVTDGSVAFSDVDGDGDEDVIVSGNKSESYGIRYAATRLYLNDGNGIFTGAPVAFKAAMKSSISFADIDGDGDNDVLITGVDQDWGGTPYSALYKNNGTGIFTEFTGSGVDGVVNSFVAFSDIDNDGDQDLLTTGEDNSWPRERVSRLYTNDGAGVFSQVLNTPFLDVKNSAIAFADVDNDGDEDVLITGNSTVGPISYLYKNDGTGTFFHVLGTTFTGVESGTVSFSDVENDGDEDVLITDANGSKLYMNDGSGVFSEYSESLFPNMGSGSVAFADVDNDGDDDVLYVGHRKVRLYKNTGLLVEVTPNEDQDSISIEEELNVRNFEYSMYPNPTEANSMNLDITLKDSGMVDIQIFDFKGEVLIQEQKNLQEGTSTLYMDISSFRRGIYLIKIDDGKKVDTRKFMVN